MYPQANRRRARADHVTKERGGDPFCAIGSITVASERRSCHVVVERLLPELQLRAQGRVRQPRDHLYPEGSQDPHRVVEASLRPGATALVTRLQATQLTKNHAGFAVPLLAGGPDHETEAMVQSTCKCAGAAEAADGTMASVSWWERARSGSENHVIV